VSGAGAGAPGLAHAERQDWSWGERSFVSDFLQEIVAPRRSLSAASIQKQRALGIASSRPAAALSGKSTSESANRGLTCEAGRESLPRPQLLSMQPQTAQSLGLRLSPSVSWKLYG
jgi:hypothetical protein